MRSLPPFMIKYLGVLTQADICVSSSITSESWNFQKWVKGVSYWSVNGLWINVLIINHKEIIDDVSYQIPWWKQVKWGHQFPCQESVNLILKVWEACWYSGAFRWGTCSANVCFPLTLKQLLLIFLLNVCRICKFRKFPMLIELLSDAYLMFHIKINDDSCDLLFHTHLFP